MTVLLQKKPKMTKTLQMLQYSTTSNIQKQFVLLRLEDRQTNDHSAVNFRFDADQPTHTSSRINTARGFVLTQVFSFSIYCGQDPGWINIKHNSKKTMIHF